MSRPGQWVINTSPVCISDCPGFSTGLLFSLSDCCCLFVNSVCLSVCPSVFTGFSINYFFTRLSGFPTRLLSSLLTCDVCVPAALARAGQKMASDARASSHGKTEPLKTTVSVCQSVFQFLCLCVSMCALSLQSVCLSLSLSPTVCISKRAIRGVVRMYLPSTGTDHAYVF